MKYQQLRDKRGKLVCEIIFPTGHLVAIQNGWSEATEFKFKKVKHLRHFLSHNPEFQKNGDILIDKEGYHIFMHFTDGLPFPDIDNN